VANAITASFSLDRSSTRCTLRSTRTELCSIAAFSKESVEAELFLSLITSTLFFLLKRENELFPESQRFPAEGSRTRTKRKRLFHNRQDAKEHSAKRKERLSHRTFQLLLLLADRDAETREAASPPGGSYPATVYPR